MKKERIFKVVIMENVKTSSLVWVSFIQADSKKAIQNYINKSDCVLLHVEEIDELEREYLDKGIDKLVNGEMIYHS